MKLRIFRWKYLRLLNENTLQGQQDFAVLFVLLMVDVLPIIPVLFIV